MSNRPFVFIFLLLASLSAWPGNDESATMSFSLPGQPLAYEEATTAVPPEYLEKNFWYSVSINDESLKIDRVRQTRPSDWLYVEGKNSEEFAGVVADFSKRGSPALALPEGSLFAFSTSDKRRFKPGQYPSLLNSGQILRTDWEQTISLGAETWTVFTLHEKRPDGILLAGSITLVASNSKGERRVLVPPATEMAFARQELLWLGDLDGDAKPDVLLKRVWITGEVDYVFAVENLSGSVYEDPDHPYRAFSSGIEESFSVFRHVDQRVPMPRGDFEKAGFAFSDEDWNRMLDEAAKTKLPKLLADRSLAVDGERIRFTFEYLPRAEASGNFSHSSRSENFSWEGPVLVRVHFRDGSQVLMQAPPLDGGGIGIQVALLNGEPAIRISFQPHYNNDFTRYWIWNPAGKGRFQRLLIDQSQGC